MIAKAFMLVPLLDFTSWYVNDDAWGDAGVSEWDTVISYNLINGSWKAAVIGISMFVPFVKKYICHLMGLSAVLETVNWYLVYRAHDVQSSTNNSTKITLAASGLAGPIS